MSFDERNGATKMMENLMHKMKNCESQGHLKN